MVKEMPKQSLPKLRQKMNLLQLKRLRIFRKLQLKSKMKLKKQIFKKIQLKQYQLSYQLNPVLLATTWHHLF